MAGEQRGDPEVGMGPQAAGASLGAGTLVWFRKGLRLHDNRALGSALARSGRLVYPVFVLDPWFLHPTKVGPNRIRFLLESLSDLDSGLRRDLGTRLIVLRGSPEEVLPLAARDWGCGMCCYEKDTEPYAKERDAKVAAALQEVAGCGAEASPGHTLWDMDALLAACGGRAPQTMTSFLALAKKVGDPGPPEPAPTGLALASPPAPFTWDATSHGVPGMGDLPHYVEASRTDEERKAKCPFRGGETEALERLARLGQERGAGAGQAPRGDAYIHAFSKPDTSPTCPTQPSTTALSPYLKFGCLSARTVYARLKEAEARKGAGPQTQPPVSLLGQLYWREHFYLLGHQMGGAFGRMHGSPIAKQVPWERNAALVRAWKEARTGFPWIDACMVQLREQGWMHHLGRHAVACFLTRGDLWQHWEEGAAVFDELLLDADWSLNSANWLWLSASAFFAQYFRVYGPHSFAKKTDPTGAYVRHFLPALRHMPDKYIYEPWTAPRDVQERAKCIVGVDYPFPLVDHAAASKANIDRLKLAYSAAKDGKAPPAEDVAAVETHAGDTAVAVAPGVVEYTPGVRVMNYGGTDGTSPAPEPAPGTKRSGGGGSKQTTLDALVKRPKT